MAVVSFECSRENIDCRRFRCSENHDEGNKGVVRERGRPLTLIYMASRLEDRFLGILKCRFAVSISRDGKEENSPGPGQPRSERQQSRFSVDQKLTILFFLRFEMSFVHHPHLQIHRPAGPLFARRIREFRRPLEREMRMICRGALTCLLAEADRPLLCRHFCGCVVRLVIEKVVERGRIEFSCKRFRMGRSARGKGGIKKVGRHNFLQT